MNVSGTQLAVILTVSVCGNGFPGGAGLSSRGHQTGFLRMSESWWQSCHLVSVKPDSVEDPADQYECNCENGHEQGKCLPFHNLPQNQHLRQ